jgi:ribosomal-protein-alanine N-acetyltransferase
MEELLASHSRYFLIAEVGEDAVGFVSGRGMGQEAEILNLAVKQANRRQGIGRTLVEELLKILREDSSETVFLEVRESNTRAKSFYRALGFEEAGRRVGYYRQPEEAAVVMRTKLRSEVRRVTIE